MPKKIELPQIVIDAIIKNRQCSIGTAKSYTSNIKKIYESISNNDQPFQNLDFILSNHEEILAFIKNMDKSDNTKLNYLKAIIATMTSVIKENDNDRRGITIVLDGFEEIEKIYREYFDQLNLKLVSDRNSGKKSNKQESNWMKWDDILKQVQIIQDEFDKLNIDTNSSPNQNKKKRNKEMQIIQKLAISLLYTELEPRRTEYAGHTVDEIVITDNVKDIITKTYGTKWLTWNEFDTLHDEEKNNNNYLITKFKTDFDISNIPTLNDIESMYFSLAKWKMSHKYGIQNIKLNDKLTHIFLLWRKWNTFPFVFIQIRPRGKGIDANDIDGTPISNNGFVNLISSIFSTEEKKVSIDMLRTIYKTTFLKDAYQKIEDSAKAMGHSEAIGKTYVKN